MKGQGRLLRRQVDEIEAKVSGGPRSDAPGMVTLLDFQDDATGAAEAFAEALRAYFAESRPFIQVLSFAFSRPPGLVPQWEPGRRWWLDVQPTPGQLADLMAVPDA